MFERGTSRIDEAEGRALAAAPTAEDEDEIGRPGVGVLPRTGGGMTTTTGTKTMAARPEPVPGGWMRVYGPDPVVVAETTKTTIREGSGREVTVKKEEEEADGGGSGGAS